MIKIQGKKEKKLIIPPWVSITAETLRLNNFPSEKELDTVLHNRWQLESDHDGTIDETIPEYQKLNENNLKIVNIDVFDLGREHIETLYHLI